MRFKKWVMATPAFHKVDKDPSKNYGVHGLDLAFYLKGPKGGVSFVISTNWMLPETNEWWRSTGRGVGLYDDGDSFLNKPFPSDLGYHSPVPMWEGQESFTDDCKIVNGKCYYDGSTLNAKEPFNVLVAEGTDGLWKYLKNYYHETFDDQGGE